MTITTVVVKIKKRKYTGIYLYNTTPININNSIILLKNIDIDMTFFMRAFQNHGANDDHFQERLEILVGLKFFTRYWKHYLLRYKN